MCFFPLLHQHHQQRFSSFFLLRYLGQVFLADNKFLLIVFKFSLGRIQQRLDFSELFILFFFFSFNIFQRFQLIQLGFSFFKLLLEFFNLFFKYIT